MFTEKALLWKIIFMKTYPLTSAFFKQSRLRRSGGIRVISNDRMHVIVESWSGLVMNEIPYCFLFLGENHGFGLKSFTWFSSKALWSNSNHRMAFWEADTSLTPTSPIQKWGHSKAYHFTHRLFFVLRKIRKKLVLMTTPDCRILIICISGKALE